MADKEFLDDVFAVEDDFAYFCMWDDLMGFGSAVSAPELPAIADSCYVDRSEVFLPPRNSYVNKN